MRLTEEQQQKIEEVGRKYRLKFILLHGSYATNKIRRGSDLDIALLGEKPIEFEELLAISTCLCLSMSIVKLVFSAFVILC